MFSRRIELRRYTALEWTLSERINRFILRIRCWWVFSKIGLILKEPSFELLIFSRRRNLFSVEIVNRTTDPSITMNERKFSEYNSSNCIWELITWNFMYSTCMKFVIEISSIHPMSIFFGISGMETLSNSSNFSLKLKWMVKIKLLLLLTPN